MLSKDNAGYSNKMSISRTRLQYCKIVLITSLFWVLVDAFVILYVTDCSAYMRQAPPCPEVKQEAQKIVVQDDHKKPIDDKPPNHDYDEDLKLKNDRLHNVHKQKKNKFFREYDPARYIGSSPKVDSQTNLLNRIKQWFKEDNSNEPKNPGHWPGENGRAVVIPDKLKADSEKRFKENQFNIVASDITALNRSVPDQRSERYYLKKKNFKVYNKKMKADILYSRFNVFSWSFQGPKIMI